MFLKDYKQVQLQDNQRQSARQLSGRPNILSYNVKWNKIYCILIGLILVVGSLLILTNFSKQRTIEDFQNSKAIYQQIKQKLGLNNQIYEISSATQILPEHESKYMLQPQEIMVSYQQNNQQFIKYLMQKIENLQNRIQVEKQQKYNEDIQNKKIITITYQDSSLSNQAYRSQCLLVNAVEQEQFHQQSIDSYYNKIHNLRKIVWLFHSIEQVQSFINKTEKQIQFFQNSYALLSNYQFLKNPLNECNQIIYARSSFILAQKTFPQLNQQIQFIYAAPQEIPVIKDDQKINITNLDTVDPTFVAQHLLIFKKNLLDIIAPVNFALFNKYTLTQIISYPLLAIFIGSQKILQSQKLHTLKQTIIDKQLFSFSQLKEDTSHLCFVNYPWNLRQANQTDYHEYLQVFNKDIPKNASIITSFKYGDQSLWPMFQMALSLSKQGINIRIKIKHKIMTSIQWYQAGLIYCPKSSTIFASRHNIQPLKQSITNPQIRNLCSLSESTNTNHSYYIIPAGFQNQFDKILVNKKLEKLNYQQDYPINEYGENLLKSQIFCEHLIRSIDFENLRWKQNQFYENQFPVILQLLLRVKNNYHNTKTAYLKRRYYKKSILLKILISEQMNGFQNRLPFLNFSQSIPLTPSNYNHLKNMGFAKNNIQYIPRIIHQISLQEITPIQQALIQTLKHKNPSFEYRMWNKQDLTQSRFPYTFPVIQKLMKLDTTENKYLIIELMKIQLLYHYGGLYIDKKYEAKKSLGPLLRFKTIFADIKKTKLLNDEHQEYFITKMMGFRKSDPKLVTLIYAITKNIKIFNRKDYNQNIIGMLFNSMYTQQQRSTQILIAKDLVWRQPNQIPPSTCHYLGYTTEPNNTHIVQYQGEDIMLQIPCPYNHQLYLDYMFQLQK